MSKRIFRVYFDFSGESQLDISAYSEDEAREYASEYFKALNPIDGLNIEISDVWAIPDDYERIEK